jgi:hypothetical protein
MLLRFICYNFCKFCGFLLYLDFRVWGHNLLGQVDRPMAKLTWWRSTVIVGFLLASCTPALPPKPFSWEVAPTQVVALMDEIHSRPVLVRFLNSTTERSAQIGTVLRVGESVRTETNAMTQVALNNGVIVRLGDNSALTLKSPAQVSVDSGKVLVAARLENGKPLPKPIEILVPFGTITSTNGVFYVEVPPQPHKNPKVFVLEGTLTNKLRSGKTINLQKGDELQIKPDGTGDKVVRPAQSELESRFAKSDLLFGFATRFAGQSLWESQLKVARREISTVRYRPKDLSRNRPTARPAPVTPSEPVVPSEPIAPSEPVTPVVRRNPPPPVKPTSAPPPPAEPPAPPPEVVTEPEPPPVMEVPAPEPPPPVMEVPAPEPLP